MGADEKFEEWAIVELMGHRRLAGLVSEQTIAGAAFLRIDVPAEDGSVATQFYGAASVYCLTPTSEEIARAAARRSVVAPVARWELEAPKAAPARRNEDDEDDEDDDYAEDDE